MGSVAPRKARQRLPTGWTEELVRKVIDYYDNQSDDEAAAEIEAALKSPKMTMIQVPSVLLPAVRKLIARNMALRADALRAIGSPRTSRKPTGRTATVGKRPPRKRR